jgi:hypothetical protein
MSPDQSLAKHYLEDAIASFRAYKRLAEKALDQLTPEEFFATIDAEANSVGVIMKHIAGNMLSRWTNFLTTDGEKPDRQRDLEFVIEPETTRDDLLAYWERGWNCLFTALDPLQSDDFDRKVKIRGEEHTVVQAINRQLTHYAYHIGQIVFLAKHFRSGKWQSLSIPRNRSAEFNQYLNEQGAQVAKEHRLDAGVNFARKSEDREQ